jgi:hypothetical protein
MKRFILGLCLLLFVGGCGTANSETNASKNENESKEATTSSVDLANFETGLVVEPTEDKAVFNITFTNKGDEDANVTFSSGQKFELVVQDSTGKEVYRYSTGKMFTMALEMIKLAPGESIELQDEWDYIVDGNRVEPGEYKAIVTVIPREINKESIDPNTFQAEKTFTVDAVSGSASGTEGDTSSQSDSTTNKENVAFRNIKVTGENGEYTVTGEARVFEAVFLYTVEDGHNEIIKETPFYANEGAPSWSKFELKLSIPKEKLPTNGTLTIHIYERSAKDGSVVNSYYAPLQQFK